MKSIRQQHDAHETVIDNTETTFSIATTDTGKWPMLLVFPEGTTKCGDYLVRATTVRSSQHTQPFL